VACLVAQGVRFVVGPQDPRDVTRDTARDLSALVGELAAERYFEGLLASIFYP
jgi:hypothetical protein